MDKDNQVIVVGSGPNGLAAAITMARAGYSVTVLEGKKTIGGGLRSAELTLPGFVHDLCSAIHPLAMSSPFFSTLPLADFGLTWIEPPAPLFHPLENGPPLLLEHSIDATAGSLDQDGNAYRALFRPLVESWPNIENSILGPLKFPEHPWDFFRFARSGLRSAQGLVNSWFHGRRAKALFGGLAAHSILPLDKVTTAAFGLVLGTLAHRTGWPFPKGGSQNLANALAAYLQSLGGKIETDKMIHSLAEIPPARFVFLDITPRQFIQMAGDFLPSFYRKRLSTYRYGTGVYKIDWALSQPIPWKVKEGQRAATVHLGGTFEEIALAEKKVWKGGLPEKPYMILAQPSLFDLTRAPAGKHTAWAYCHVPHGSVDDLHALLEDQVEAAAPGFKDCILARHTLNTRQLQDYNPNYIGGDIIGGVQDLFQLFSRPLLQVNPYATPLKGIYLCSSSTPPGGGVHGMCGLHAAKAALRLP